MSGWRYVMAVAAGILTVFVGEAGWIYGPGLTASLPAGAVSHISAPLAEEINAQWPRLRGSVSKNFEPLMRAEVRQMVSEVRLDVGGVPISLPLSFQQRLSDRISRLLWVNLNDYLEHQFNPSQVFTPDLIRQALARPILLHVWIRVNGIPVPMTVRLGGESKSRQGSGKS